MPHLTEETRREAIAIWGDYVNVRDAIEDAILASDATTNILGLDFDYLAPAPPVGLDNLDGIVLPAAAGSFAVLARHALPLAVVERNRMQVGSKPAWAALVAAVARRDGVDIELSGKNRTHAAAVTRDPSKPRRWRVTWFDDQGPWGHVEAESEFKAVLEAMNAGFVTLSPGAVARVMAGGSA